MSTQLTVTHNDTDIRADDTAAPARTFTLAGRFDAHEADAVKAEMLDAVDSGATALRVDLSAVDFLDSSALAVLTSVMKRCRELGGDLVIVDPSDPVRVILELTRLDRAFVIR